MTQQEVVAHEGLLAALNGTEVDLFGAICVVEVRGQALEERRIEGVLTVQMVSPEMFTPCERLNAVGTMKLLFGSLADGSAGSSAGASGSLRLLLRGHRGVVVGSCGRVVFWTVYVCVVHAL